MRQGGWLHREGLLAPAAALFQSLEATVRWEHPAGPGRYAGYVDLFVIYCLLRIVIEAELLPRRVKNDLRKATTLDADLLIFLVPTHRVAELIRRRLASAGSRETPETMRIWILTPGLLHQRIVNLGQKGFRSYVLLSSVPQSPDPIPQ
jgi:hypothetical protein